MDRFDARPEVSNTNAFDRPQIDDPVQRQVFNFLPVASARNQLDLVAPQLLRICELNAPQELSHTLPGVAVCRPMRRYGRAFLPHKAINRHRQSPLSDALARHDELAVWHLGDDERSKNKRGQDSEDQCFHDRHRIVRPGAELGKLRQSSAAGGTSLFVFPCLPKFMDNL